MSNIEFESAQDASTQEWLVHLREMLSDAESRFADVSWRTHDDGDEAGRCESKGGELLFGHKWVVYSRSGAFQRRFLGGIATTTTSEADLRQPLSEASDRSSSLSPISATRIILLPDNIVTPIDLVGVPAGLFNLGLELLYSAKPEMKSVLKMLLEGFGDGDANDEGGDQTKGGIDRLRRDLLFAWRAKLFVDCQITLDDSTPSNPTTSFSVHRSLLASRSPYFHALLLGNFGDSHHTSFNLPSPPFTAASMSFVLGWLYTGTLSFGERTFDLKTAFEIWRSAAYLSLERLQIEVGLRIEMMINQKRAARIYQFAIAGDVADQRLAQISAVFLARDFDRLWVCSILGELDIGERDALVDAVDKLVTPTTVTNIVKKCFVIRKKLDLERSSWVLNILEMVQQTERKEISRVLASDLMLVVRSKEFVDLIDGVGFSSNDVLEFMLDLVVRHLSESTAALSYEALFSSIKLREDGLLMDAMVLVQHAKKNILRYIQSRWMSIRTLRGFDALDLCCLKELSTDLSVPVEELLAASNKSSSLVSRTGLRVASRRNPSSSFGSTSSDQAAARSRSAALDRSAARVAAISARSASVAVQVETRTTRQPLADHRPSQLRSARSYTPSSPPKLSPIRPARIPPHKSSSSVAQLLSPSTAATRSTGLRRPNSTPTVRPLSTTPSSSSLKHVVADSFDDATTDVRRSTSMRSLLPLSQRTNIIIPAKRLSPSSNARNLSSSAASSSPISSSSSSLIARGTALLSGIPCIVTSNSNQFKATVRYIGPVAGSDGEWMGIEVDNSPERMLDVDNANAEGLDWNDGSIDGMRYFELGTKVTSRAATPELRTESSLLLLRPSSVMALRNNRRSSYPEHGSGGEAFKGERRGLFVRPSQIVYVL